MDGSLERVARQIIVVNASGSALYFRLRGRLEGVTVTKNIVRTVVGLVLLDELCLLALPATNTRVVRVHEFTPFLATVEALEIEFHFARTFFFFFFTRAEARRPS